MARRTVSKDGPDPIDIHVGQELRSRRLELGMSQTVLGEKLGLSFQQVQKYERGANRLSSSTLFRAARELGVSVNYFFEQLSDEAVFSDTTPLPRAAHAIARNYLRIRDPKVQQEIAALVKALARME